MEQLLAQFPLFLLIMSRVAGVVAASPVFNNRFMPVTLRAAFAFVLSLVLLPAVQQAPGATEGAALLAAVVLELLVGLTIGFLGQLTFAVAQMAGTLLDLELGFSIAQIIDPFTNRSEPITGAFFQTLTLVIYFAANAHHLLIRALAESYASVPPGGLVVGTEAPLHVVSLFGALLGSAVKMVLPFLAVMLLATLVLAGINRAVPQMQIFAVGMGIKAVAGLALLALMFPYFLGFLEAVFSGGHSELLRTLDLMR
jgi:flagellar biosynthetic protein FliR